MSKFMENVLIFVQPKSYFPLMESNSLLFYKFADFQVLEIFPTEVNILSIYSLNFSLFIKTMAIHFTEARVISCAIREYNYNLPIEHANLTNTILNDTHSITTCVSVIQWNPAKSDPVFQSEFQYLLANTSLWTIVAPNGTIRDYTAVSGIS